MTYESPTLAAYGRIEELTTMTDGRYGGPGGNPLP